MHEAVHDAGIAIWACNIQKSRHAALEVTCLHKALAHVLQHVLSRHPHGHVLAGPQGMEGPLYEGPPIGPLY